jgi:hypothetical protein
VLEPKLFDCRFHSSVGQGEDNASTGFEQPWVIELDPDANRTVQALGPGDAGDGDAGALRTTDELLQDFESEPLLQLHPGGTENGSNGLCCPTLFSYDLPKVALRDAQFQNRGLLAFDRANGNFVGIVDQCFRDLFDEVLHGTASDPGKSSHNSRN